MMVEGGCGHSVATADCGTSLTYKMRPPRLRTSVECWHQDGWRRSRRGVDTLRHGRHTEGRPRVVVRQSKGTSWPPCKSVTAAGSLGQWPRGMRRKYVENVTRYPIHHRRCSMVVLCIVVLTTFACGINNLRVCVLCGVLCSILLYLDGDALKGSRSGRANEV